MINKDNGLYYFFVNPESGEKKAADLVKGDIQTLLFKSGLGSVNMVDMSKESSKKEAFESLLKIQNDYQSSTAVTPIIVVLGGDGSLIGLVEELVVNNLKPHLTNFCVLPFGTGNDLAQATGWGADATAIMKEDIFTTISAVLRDIRLATAKNINVWEVTVVCRVTDYRIINFIG
jgi:diacylglycerol kinase (ATP)